MNKKTRMYRLLIVLALILSLSVIITIYAAPDPTIGESRSSLNGSWKFKTDSGNVGESSSWFAVAYDDSSWDTQKVPGNWDTSNAYSNYKGKAWYRRTFTAPTEYNGYPVRVRFEAAYEDTKVWVNGTYIGAHSGGYAPFEFDVTSLLNYGSTNTVAVMVDNTYGVGAWWKWGGLNRDVNLIANNTSRIEWQKVTATPDLVAGTAAVNIKVKVLNNSGSSKTVTVESKIYDKASGAVVWSSTDDSALRTSVSVPASSNLVADLNTTLPAAKVKLWHFDFPNLYKMETWISEASTLKHKISNNFGIRKIEISGTQFKLNGELVRLVGFNRVPDDRVNGNTEPNYLVKRDIDLMKIMGANCARIFHAPQDPDLLDYCDEKGILLICEIPVWGSGDSHVVKDNAEAKQWLKEMIERDYNHPSIFAWSPANEIAGTSTNGIEYVKSMHDYIRANLDTSRPLTYVSNTAWNAGSSTGDAAQWCDFICINQYGSYASGADTVHSLWPNVPIFISEYGTGQNNEDPNIGDVNADSILNNYRSRSFVMGASVWTLNDYRSAYSGTPASENRVWGVTTVWGDRKKGFNSLWRADSPVKSLTTSHDTTVFNPGQNVVTTVTISPRGSLATDLPAYVMKGYKLKWEIFDTSYNLADGGVVNLPNLSPGSGSWPGYANWTVPAGGALQQRITVLSPANYPVYEYNNYFSVPAAPSIKEVLVASGAARVVFNRVNGATSYKVRYGTTALSTTTSTTINGFIDITGLANGTSYQFAAVASNGKGDSANSSVVYAVPATANALLPPVIWNDLPVDAGFYVGYSVDSADTNFAIKYGTSSGSYPYTLSNITNKGACVVSGLANGTTYYYRMMRNGSGASGYSEEISIKPESATAVPRQPQLYGALKGDGQAALSFEAVEKATGYKVKYGTSPGSYPNVITVNQAAVGHYVVTGLTNGTPYYFVVSALNDNGESVNSSEKSVTPGTAPPTPTPGPTATPTPTPNGIVIDNGGTGYAETGTWGDSSLTGYNGTSTRWTSTAGSTAKWTPAIGAAGSYNVYVWYPYHTSSTTNAKYTVTYNGGSEDIYVDQTQNADGWRLLTTRSFAAGTGGNVTLTAVDTTIHRADAAMFELIGGPTPTPAPTATPTPTATPSPTPWASLFSDDFEDGNSTGWTVVSGSWSVVTDGTKVFKQTGTTGEGVVYAGNASWTNYTVQARVKLYDMISLAASGIIGRYKDSNNFYLLRLHQSGKMQLYKKVSGTFTLLQEATATVSTNTWYTLKLVLNGSTLTGYVDGVQKVSAVDGSVVSGCIGARAYTQSVGIDDVVVN
jgi:beta-galactosidase